MERRDLDDIYSGRSIFAPQNQFGGYRVARLNVHGYSGLVWEPNVSAASERIDMNSTKVVIL